MTNLEQEAGIFGASLVIYAERQRLPRSLFDRPDHLTVRTPNIDDFAQLTRGELAPRSREMFCTETDWQFRISARLKGWIAIYHLGIVEWVVVEEPGENKVVTTGIQNTVFYHDSLEAAQGVLSKRGIQSIIVPDKNSAYVGVEFEPGLEFRITDTLLEDVTEAQLDSKETIEVELGPRQTSIEII